MLYLDTSALVKLIFAEPESAALDAFVGSDDLAVSALSRTELCRVALRIAPAQLPACDELLQSCFEVALTPRLLDRAGRTEPGSLRSLDAIHLACAQTLAAELSAFVAYDQRLADAAIRAGLTVVSPR